MITRPLKLARVFCRIDYKPKSILYYAKRAEFASVYFPAPYPDWEFGPTSLRLTNNETKTRIVVESGSLAIEADQPSSVASLQDHFLEVSDRARNQFMGQSKPHRFGWRVVFVLEHSSFEELFPTFIENTIGDMEWARIPSKRIRDSAVRLYYGKEDDGINLSLGVLTPEQAIKFRDEKRFKSTDVEKALAIDKGTLMIDLDRFSRHSTRKREMRELLNEHTTLVDQANALMAKLLSKPNA